MSLDLVLGPQHWYFYLEGPVRPTPLLLHLERQRNQPASWLEKRESEMRDKGLQRLRTMHALALPTVATTASKQTNKQSRTNILVKRNRNGNWLIIGNFVGMRRRVADMTGITAFFRE